MRSASRQPGWIGHLHRVVRHPRLASPRRRSKETQGARRLAGLATSCFLASLVGSGAGLVPIERRVVDPGSGLSSADVERLRTRRLRGHLIRTLIALWPTIAMASRTPTSQVHYQDLAARIDARVWSSSETRTETNLRPHLRPSTQDGSPTRRGTALCLVKDGMPSQWRPTCARIWHNDWGRPWRQAGCLERDAYRPHRPRPGPAGPPAGRRGRSDHARSDGRAGNGRLRR
jgi:hypothetical protein